MSSLWNRLRGLSPRACAGLALGAAWAAFWAPLLITSRVPYERDILVTVLPLRQYFRERLLSGHWPEWYPYELLGVPFSGSIVASPFHPQTLLYLLLSPGVAAKWCLLLGSLFGLVGAYRLARELGASRIGSVTAACVFSFGGFTISLASNPAFFIPLATAPWLLAAAHRLARRDRGRDVAVLAIWWALLLTGGDVQLFLEGGLVALAMILVETRRAKVLLRFGIGAILAGLLSAGELVPALASEAESVRHGWQGSPALASIWAFHPLRLLDFVIPHFVPLTHRLEVGFTLEGQPDLFASTLYIGGTALLLAAFSFYRKPRAPPFFWGVVALVGLWLASGVHGGLIELWWSALPPFAKFRFPEKYLALTVLALVPLVARGTDAALARPRRMLWVAFGAGGLAILLALTVAPAALVEEANRVSALARPFRGTLAALLAGTWSNGLLRAGAELLVAGALFFFLASGERAAPLVPALVFGSLVLANTGRVPLASRSIVDGRSPFAAAFARRHDPHAPPPRVLPAVGGTREKDLADDALVSQIRLWMLADDAGRSHVTAWAENSSAERERALRYLGGVSFSHWQEMNVCYRIANDQHPVRPDETVVAAVADPWLTLAQRPCGPPAFVATSARPVADEAQAVAAVNEGLADGAVVWEQGPALDGGGGTVHWVQADPERLVLDVSATNRSALVVTDGWASGWSAMVDGDPTPIYPANVAARGVVIPPGRHTVTMTYRAPGLIAGLLLMLLGVIGVVLLPKRLDRAGSIL